MCKGHSNVLHDSFAQEEDKQPYPASLHSVA